MVWLRASVSVCLWARAECGCVVCESVRVRVRECVCVAGATDWQRSLFYVLVRER